MSVENSPAIGMRRERRRSWIASIVSIKSRVPRSRIESVSSAYTPPIEPIVRMSTTTTRSPASVTRSARCTSACVLPVPRRPKTIWWSVEINRVLSGPSSANAALRCSGGDASALLLRRMSASFIAEYMVERRYPKLRGTGNRDSERERTAASARGSRNGFARRYGRPRVRRGTQKAVAFSVVGPVCCTRRKWWPTKSQTGVWSDSRREDGSVDEWTPGRGARRASRRTDRPLLLSRRASSLDLSPAGSTRPEHLVGDRFCVSDGSARAVALATQERSAGAKAQRALCHDLDRQGQPSRAIASPESERPHRRRVSRHTPAPVHRQRALVAGVLVSPAIGEEQGRCASALVCAHLREDADVIARSGLPWFSPNSRRVSRLGRRWQAIALEFSEKLDRRCAVGARCGLSLTASG